MRKTSGLAIAGLAAALLAATMCRTVPSAATRKPTPTAAASSRLPTVTAAPGTSHSMTVTPMPVISAAPSSMYNRTPGVLYEHQGTPSPTASPR